MPHVTDRRADLGAHRRPLDIAITIAALDHIVSASPASGGMTSSHVGRWVFGHCTGEEF